MPRKNFQRRLTQLRTDVCSMADLVDERYETAVRAYERGDEALAREVISGDGKINDRYLALENDCTDLLALQQPVAGDLRFVAASFKILTDLERVGDLAVNLAEYALETDGGVHPALDLRAIADPAGEMLRDAMAAYEASDPEACRAVAARDDDLDAVCEEASTAVVRSLIEEGTDPSIDAVSTALLTVRDLERVGDHAVNIAARTLYSIENDDELIY